MTLPTDITVPAFPASVATLAASALLHETAHETLHAFYNGGTGFPIRWVDPDGLASNSGKHPGAAYDSIQDAYDDLSGGVGSPREFVGDIRLLPGVHDVGTGLAFENQRVVRVEGYPRTVLGHDLDGTANAVITTSDDATEHVDITDAVTANGEGFEFIGVDFDMNGIALTAGIRGRNLVYPLVEGCNFHSATQREDIWAIEFDNPGSDNSWANIIRNRSRGVGLVKILATGNSNVNRWNIKRNICFWFPADPTDLAMLDLQNLDASLVEGNNLEGSAIGVWLRDGESNSFISNAGEGVASTVAGHTNPFYRVGTAGLANAQANIFQGGDARFTGAATTTNVWIDFLHSSERNTVQQNHLVAAETASVRKAHVVDSTTAGVGNLKFGGFYTDWTAVT